MTVFNQRDFYSGKPQTRVSTPEPETKGRKNKTKKVYQEYENEEKEQVSEGYETTYIYNPKTLSAYHKSQMLQRWVTLLTDWVLTASGDYDKTISK